MHTLSKDIAAMIQVSIIVPMYNAEAFISATLASILQEHDIALEVVVVNDGSTDASLERVLAVEDRRVRVIPGPCQGIAAALNAGIAQANGKIVMRCDADDFYPPHRISRQVEWLSKHLEFGAVCGSFATVDRKGRTIINFDRQEDGLKEDSLEITQELLNGITRTHLCTFAVRVEVLRASGGCRQYFQTAEDIDLQLRLGEFCRVWYVPDIQYHYRLHDASITHTQSNVEREFFESMAREFQRQRLSQGYDSLQSGYPPIPPQRGAGSSVKAVDHMQDLLIGSAWQKHQAGYKPSALAIGIRSVIVQPSRIHAWRSLLALVVKPTGKGSNP
jgi:glycosyltransferase involved in cell wall biosynthesis